MKLKRYKDFLLESVLLTSEFLNNIINKIDDPIAKDFHNLINKDIKTKYNIIDSTDDNTQLSFVSDNQASSKIKSGIDPKDLFSLNNNKTSIGRVVKSILKDNNLNYTDKELSTFVDKFKTEYDKENISKKEIDPIKVVKGNDIKFWYLEDNYCQESTRGKGTLSKSCMRYESCQDYFDIYVENPDVVSLVIYLDDFNKLRSRALLWKTNKGIYLDRVYYTDQSEEQLLVDWAKENCNTTDNYDSNDSLIVKCSDMDYEEYPYMDTFSYYNKSSHTLYNYEPNDDNSNMIELNDTDGGGRALDSVYCEFENEYYPEDETVYSDYSNVSIHKDNAVWSDYENSYLWKNNAEYSEYLKDYIEVDNAVSVYMDEEGTKSDYFPAGSDEVGVDLDTDVYYLSSLLVLTEDGETILPKNVIELYDIEGNESISEYKRIYNSEFYIAPKIDKVVFDFELDEDPMIYSKYTYYAKVYSKTIYKHLVDKVKSLDIPTDIKEKKLSEMSNANLYLKNNYGSYKKINGIYDIGIDKLISENLDWFVNLIDSKLVDLDRFIMNYKNGYLKDKNKEDVKKFKDLTYKICKDPLVIDDDESIKKSLNEFLNDKSDTDNKFYSTLILNIKETLLSDINYDYKTPSQDLLLYYIRNKKDFK
jgi:hypothetical protein